MSDTTLARYRAFSDIPDPREYQRCQELCAHALSVLEDDPASLSDAQIEDIALMTSPRHRKAALLARNAALLADIKHETALSKKPAPPAENDEATPLLDSKATMSDLLDVANLLIDEMATMRARIAALEQRPVGLKYCGTWASGRPYDPGDVVTDAGSMWVARTTTMGRPGMDHPAWQLSVKRGKDGRDGRP